MSTVVPVVFDLESRDLPAPLGTFIREDEDVVVYETPDGRYSAAPCDCVKVVRVEVFPR